VNHGNEPQQAPQPAYLNTRRAKRKLARRHRAVLSKAIECPSENTAFLSVSGKATQRRFLKDIFTVMDWAVSELCYRTLKIGIHTRSGFLLRTWHHCAEKTGLPLWRVRQCVKYAFDKGWISSVQPREWDENRGEYRGLASIKRVTLKYFEDVALSDALYEASRETTKYLKETAKAWGMSIKHMLTPITLLQKFRARKAAKKAQAKQAAPKYRNKDTLDLSQFDALSASRGRYTPPDGIPY
jgi:hypothetical protein